MALNKINVPSVREAFVLEIESKILSGELKTGDRLPPARELCTIMGVSLTVVNAGVSELAAKGFLEVRPRHGTYVADYKLNGNTETFSAIMRYNGDKMDGHVVRSYCETRIALDPFVAGLVIERADDGQIAQLGDYVEKLRHIGTTEEFGSALTEFFRQIYLLSDNTILILFYNSTFDAQASMYSAFVRKNGREYTIKNAELVYESFAARDAKSAGVHLIAALTAAMTGEMSIINN